MDAITLSTQIDPLTGLPMVFDSIIEQIPLDAQIFPYADLGATARPTAPPLYPDSIIPVSAFLSGQHPDTGSAQTVATNGDHDLRVHVTNASSGGAAPIPAAALNGNNGLLRHATGPHHTFTAAFNFGTLLYGYTFGLHYMSEVGGSTIETLALSIIEPVSNSQIYLWLGDNSKSNGPSMWGYKELQWSVMFPQPVEVSSITNGNPMDWDLQVDNMAFDYSIGLLLMAI